MDHVTREQRRRETAVRLAASHADIATSLLSRVPSIASTSMRGGVLALLLNLRQGSRTEGERASLNRIIESLGRLKGAAMKVGQHLSYFDQTLPSDVRAALAALQTHSPPMSVTRIAKIVRDELGEHALALDPIPLASASIGQVHTGRLPDGTQVAVKVQYPGIATAIKADFGPASLAGRFGAWLYPSSQIKSYLKEARARALDECDYVAEARHQADLAARYADHPMIVIPAPIAKFCTPRVLVTPLVAGSHIGTWLVTGPSQAAREAIGEALVTFYVGSALRWGILPGDPHPGNYLVTADGRLAIVDHGCTQPVAAARARPVLEAEDERSARHAGAALGASALLLLRVRLGLAAVLGELGVRTSWRELVARATAPLPNRFVVVLVAAGERTIEIVREVRDLLGADISRAKELVDRAPAILRTTTDRKEAEALKRRLEASGAVVEIRASHEP